MTTLAIIGTAGRKDDANKLNSRVYDQMYALVIESILGLKVDTVASGGAAWADHLAVRAYNDQMVENLILHLPAEFKSGQYHDAGYQSPGSISNYYHKRFSSTCDIKSLLEIATAINSGAQVTVSNGFFARNTSVGKANYLLAFTYGTSSRAYQVNSSGYHNSQAAGLKDGGTAHTWRYSSANVKRHVNIHEL